MSRRLTANFALLCLVACCCDWSHAQESPLAPLLPDEAYAVARVEVERLEVRPLLAMLNSVTGLTRLPREQDLDQFLTRFRQAGGKQLYFVWGGGAQDFLFAPLAPGAKAAAIQAVFAENPLRLLWPIETAEQLAGGVVAGPRSMLLSLRKLRASPRPNLELALAATSGATVQLLLLPTERNRRFVEGFGWSLVRADAAATAMKHIAWVSIGFDGPPQPRLKIVFEANDAGAVDRLEAALDQSLEPLLVHPDVARNLALVENLRRILDWQREGTKLSLDLDDRRGDLTVIGRGMVKPVLESQLTVNAQAIAINQLKQINIAMQNHHDVHKRFPPPAILNGDGQTLLSWRVAILPFVEETALYKKFHLDEPWDSPHNKPLLAEMPEVYRCALSKAADDHTVYLTPRGEGTVFAGPEGTPIRGIIDGTSKTIGIVEVDDEQAVPWTKPDDWPYDPDQPSAGLGGHFPGLFLAGACDGSVHQIKLPIDPDTLRSLLSCAGREPVGFPQ